jgi:hypothetical protein
MIFVICIVAIVGAFIGWLAFTWRANVSDDPRFAPYLHIPVSIKDSATLVWQADKNQYRFKPYSFRYGESSHYNEDGIKSVKHYNPGDTIEFYEARSYYSLFVGTTYYFLGREKLSNNEEVEYEYYINLETAPQSWESLEEFVERRKNEKEAKSN